MAAELDTIIDAEIVELDEAAVRAAKQRFTKVDLLWTTATENLDKLHDLLDQARASDDWRALDYPSWTAYLGAIAKGRPLIVPRDMRPELVQMMTDQGVPGRVVAKTLGVSNATVSRDLAAVTSVTAATSGTHGATDSDLRSEQDAPAKVIGLDNKQHPAKKAPARREPKKQKQIKLLKRVTTQVVAIGELLQEIQEFDDSITQDAVDELYGDLAGGYAEIGRVLKAIALAVPA